MLALDIGGANLKAAHSDGTCVTAAFEVWRRPAELRAAIAELAAGLPAFDQVALTMTAELCDCYPTRDEGVRAILASVLGVFESFPVRVWGIDGRFHGPEAIRRQPSLAAAANWLALATVAARHFPEHHGLLIDVGSTTTDLIPLATGKVAARGRTDPDRLQSGELVYAGVKRTPICALATELAIGQGRPIGLAAELFATTLDVFLTLGDLPSDPSDRSTADGRAATVEAARARLARMICTDRQSFSIQDAHALASSAQECLLQRLTVAARRVCEATIPAVGVVVLAGSGEFLARRVAGRLVGNDGLIVSLSGRWGPAGSSAACARALLSLLDDCEPGL